MNTIFTATIEVEVEVDLDALGTSPDEIRQDMGKEPWDKVEYRELEEYINSYWSLEELIENGVVQTAEYKKVVWQ
tara:strand:+ start:233 stop:457 length:225 start_codon:yes stop_codon:yes gene_type:complete